MKTKFKPQPKLKDRLQQLDNESKVLETKQEKLNVWFTRVIVGLMGVSIIYFMVDML